MDRDPTGPERREPGGAGLDEMDPVAEPGEPDGADETDIAGADDGERTVRGASGQRVPVGVSARRPVTGGAAAGRARPCRLRPCASRSTGSKGWGTCPRSSPTRRPGSPPSSIRVATSTSISMPPGRPIFGSPTSSRRTCTTTTCRVAGSWRRSPGRRTSSAPGRARARARPARDGDTFDVGAVRFATLDTPGHTPEHVSYAVADTTRGRRAVPAPDRGLAAGRFGRTDGSARGRTTRGRSRRRCTARSTTCCCPTRTR